MQEITNKKFFINYAFFTLFLIVVFGILAYFSIASRKSYSKNLAVSVQTVLDEYNPNTWKTGENIPIDKPIEFNCSAYEITNKKDSSQAKAVIIRVTTLYGPIAGVYICYPDNSVEFAGWSSLHGRIREAVAINMPDKRVEYWAKKIPDILK